MTPEQFRLQLAELSAQIAGRALVLYLLPQGRIEFTATPT